jgi:hypothetical protein
MRKRRMGHDKGGHCKTARARSKTVRTREGSTSGKKTMGARAGTFRPIHESARVSPAAASLSSASRRQWLAMARNLSSRRPAVGELRASSASLHLSEVTQATNMPQAARRKDKCVDTYSAHMDTAQTCGQHGASHHITSHHSAAWHQGIRASQRASRTRLVTRP